MRYFVDQLVPAEFMLKQGVYLQTCAHIELVMWRIVQMIDGVDPSSREAIDRYIKLKLTTRKIIRESRLAATKCHASIGFRLLLLANRIEVGLVNRNMAAHGAWRLHPTGKLEVEHYLSNKNKELRYISERITNRAIDAALEDADMLLRIAVDLYDAVRSWGRPFISFTAAYEQTNSPEIEKLILAGTSRFTKTPRLAENRKNLMLSTALPLRLANLKT